MTGLLTLALFFGNPPQDAPKDGAVVLPPRPHYTGTSYDEVRAYWRGVLELNPWIPPLAFGFASGFVISKSTALLYPILLASGLGWPAAVAIGVAEVGIAAYATWGLYTWARGPSRAGGGVKQKLEGITP